MIDNIHDNDLVIINGERCSKKWDFIVKDFVTDEYLNLRSSSATYVNITDGVNNEGYVNIKTGYTTKYNQATTIIMSINQNRPKVKDRISFKNKEALEAFCEKYEYVLGVNTNCYYWVNNLNYDRIAPVHFNYTKSILNKNTILKNIPLPKGYENKKEFRRILEHFSSLNEKYGIESKTSLAFEGLKYTFGVEMETVSGVFTSQKDLDSIYNLNFQSVHDGSLRDADGSGPWGAEYVTGVLKGDKGLSHLHEITKVLSKKCTVDKRTSVHVHIGSLNWNSEDIVYAYLLGQMLEEEIFSFMPKSRSNNEYCKFLPDIDAHMLGGLNKSYDKEKYKKIMTLVYNKIFQVVSKKNKPSKTFNKFTQHPEGKHGGWNRETDHRYSWLNFTNIIFNQRGSLDSKTIEFRCHSGTLSYKKIHNWIKICMAIVEFVNIGKKEILNAKLNGNVISLNYILKKVYPKTSQRLIDYIKVRKDLFSSDFLNENIDYVNEDSNLKNIKDIICV